MKRIDLIGKRFGRLTVLEVIGKNKKGCYIYKCKCDCGKYKQTNSHYLLGGITKSCGCLQSESRIKHGNSGTKLYHVWLGIRNRVGDIGCLENKDKKFIDSYINRGIDICNEWKDFELFYQWSIKNGYKEGLQIDRIDNNKGYYPENCRWTTNKVNMRNRRNTLRLLDGTPFAEFLDAFGISDKKIRNRYGEMWRLKHKIHPELKQIMKETMD